jgi:DNA-binding response OmpR family regulator
MNNSHSCQESSNRNEQGLLSATPFGHSPVSAPQFIREIAELCQNASETATGRRPDAPDSVSRSLPEAEALGKQVNDRDAPELHETDPSVSPEIASEPVRTRSRIALFGEANAENESLTLLLATDDHEVFCQHSMAEFLEMINRKNFSLLIINWESHGQAGLELMRKVRLSDYANGLAPALILTTRESEFDMVRAYESGADQCVIKPWRPFELLARIKALMRFEHSRVNTWMEILHGFKFDKTSYIVTGHGIVAQLAPREFDVALFLFKNLGTVVSRADLFASFWRSDGTPRTVDQHVARVRRKLSLDATRGFVVQTVYSVGYVLRSTMAAAV